ncbi:hypothetical protein J2S13_001246 [Oikeobacillus pervagus]|uniref:Uncharacterized protein n=1 Tax=Oikeobacillus pervagus TaxID=1325931 RepID=A0AAJ1SXY2_9BACI|nr:hypothetical protein [Oikeobacillus pervagus]MDQ0214849.1 hypothetical protein [Oikeobacillus pervagus]
MFIFSPALTDSKTSTANDEEPKKIVKDNCPARSDNEKDVTCQPMPQDMVYYRAASSTNIQWGMEPPLNEVLLYAFNHVTRLLPR